MEVDKDNCIGGQRNFGQHNSCLLSASTLLVLELTFNKVGLTTFISEAGTTSFIECLTTPDGRDTPWGGSILYIKYLCLCRKFDVYIPQMIKKGVKTGKL